MWYGKASRIFKLGRELVLKNCTTFLREGNHSIVLNLPFVGKNLLKKFGIGGHVEDDIQE